MLQDHLLQAGRRVRVRPLTSLPSIGTVDIISVEAGVVNVKYKPDAKGSSPVETHFSRSDCVWLISRGLWYDPDDSSTLTRLNDDQTDDFLSERHCEEIFENVIELNAIWAPKFDEKHLLEILHRRLDMVWDRANSHRIQTMQRTPVEGKGPRAGER